MITEADLSRNRVSGQTCVWMDAGLLAYKLCDRGYDCEHCPLDAALRGVSLADASVAEATHLHIAPKVTYPNDRFYSRTHTWIKPLDADRSRMRFGLDSFAAALINVVCSIQQIPGVMSIRREQVLCILELEDGLVPLGSPLDGRFEGWNAVLTSDVSRLITDPYGSGWIAELSSRSREDRAALFSGEQATRHAQFDERRFRRRVAHALLADVAGTSQTPSDGVSPDLRQVLGPMRYLALIRELIR